MKKTLLIVGGIIAGLIILAIAGYIMLPHVLSLVAGKDSQLADDSALIPDQVDITRSGNAFTTLHSINFQETDLSVLLRWLSETNPEPIDWIQAEQILSQEQSKLQLYNQAASMDYYQVPYLADPDKVDYRSDELMIAFNSLRNGGRLASLNALYLARQGEIEPAIDQALNIYNLGYMMEDSSGNLIQFLTALSQAKAGLDTYKNIATTYQLTPGQKNYVQQYLKARPYTGQGLSSAIKYDYLTAKQQFASLKDGSFAQELSEMSEDDIDPEWENFRKLSNNKFYFKPNQTLNEVITMSEHLLAQTNAPCQYQAYPFSSLPSGLSSRITKNYVGKLLNRSVYGLAYESVFDRACELQTQLNTIINS